MPPRLACTCAPIQAIASFSVAAPYSRGLGYSDKWLLPKTVTLKRTPASAGRSRTKNWEACAERSGRLTVEVKREQRRGRPTLLSLGASRMCDKSMHAHSLRMLPARLLTSRACSMGDPPMEPEQSTTSHTSRWMDAAGPPSDAAAGAGGGTNVASATVRAAPPATRSAGVRSARRLLRCVAAGSSSMASVRSLDGSATAELSVTRHVSSPSAPAPGCSEGLVRVTGSGDSTARTLPRCAWMARSYDSVYVTLPANVGSSAATCAAYRQRSVSAQPAYTAALLLLLRRPAAVACTLRVAPCELSAMPPQL